MGTTINTYFLEIKDCNNSLVNYLVSLVNTVYSVAENNIWLTNDTRIDHSELTKLITNKQIFVAQEGNIIIGLLAINKISDSTISFGMLSTHKDHQGKGIGSLLVDAIEVWAKKLNFNTIQLELLLPIAKNNYSKNILIKWYTKIGYQKVRTESFELMYPEKAKLLACDCDFTIWQKSLI